MMKKTILAFLFGVVAAAGAQAEGKRFLTLEDAALAQAKKWQQTGVAKPILSDDGRVMYPFGQYQPKLTCTLLRACEIALEPGELLTGEPVAGDTARWKLSKRKSGSGDNETSYIIVKPIELNIETNLNIYTDRRVYHVKLEASAREQDYVHAIGFYYPEQVAEQWDESARIAAREKKEKEKRAQSEIPAGCVEGLDFAYRIEGKASFKPTRVYNACGKVYVHLPEAVTKGSSPVLVGVGKDGNAEFLNWRAKSATILEVDKLFDKAMLVLGSDDDEQRVTITWTKNENKGWFTWARGEDN
ncbi:P-type conjugative transfer protein TrbG [Agrobacterium tumefaciens]|uniref:P-type conjugative transfer protein TrbG n=1 Tax=Agrobacterium tumefaciens TaxID=358 RepID=UPI0015732A83|nr:P-type conjugative transfer protein TrbG [Agrobacterium tumefaciens]NTB05917.1 P-type conjugative transfer protein TrbG [Agrobacterium tumefaciens]